MTATDLTVQAGVPFARRIRVTDGKDVWDTLDAFETRGQIRTGHRESTDIVLDLTDHLTTAYDGNDITVDLALTGAETRALRGGYYDIILSDVGTTDAKALRILHGHVTVEPVVTSAS